MQKWLISADTQKWDIASFFAEEGYVNWIQRVNYNIGDIVYIYCSKPIQKIMFKTCVEEESIKFDVSSDEKWVRLSLIEQVDKEELSFENLKLHGLKIAPRSPIKLNEELENYIDNFFKIEDKIWMVRAGVEGVKYDIFKNNNFAAIGWNLGDLTGKNKEEIKSLCEIEYPNESSSTISSYVSMINAFVNDIKVEDLIITSSDKIKREYIIGKCISDYYYSDKVDTDKNDLYKNCRDVEWQCIIKWEDIQSDIKPPRSVFEINCSTKREILELFKPISFSSNEKRNLIFFGAPGTGKSYKLNEAKEGLLKNYNENNYERVTFHPDYTYANFVGTYKPVPYIDENGDKTISYEYVPGPFMRTLVKALKNPYEPFLLIIEEINRANVAAVFGDVFQLLDREENISQYPINVSEDVNEYLKRELDISKMEKNTQCVLKKYWDCLLGEYYDKIKIPSNMFIWATMNSADQGVFPMDTAFKRRWDFTYLGIDDSVNKIENLKFELYGEEFLWNDLRTAINKKLLSYGINEDKLIGPFFAFNEFIDDEFIPEDKFKYIFKNKIIMYLFEDAARSRRDKLFSGIENNGNIIYSDICNNFDNKEIGLKIFKFFNSERT